MASCLRCMMRPATARRSSERGIRQHGLSYTPGSDNQKQVGNSIECRCKVFGAKRLHATQLPHKLQVAPHSTQHRMPKCCPTRSIQKAPRLMAQEARNPRQLKRRRADCGRLQGAGEGSSLFSPCLFDCLFGWFTGTYTH